MADRIIIDNYLREAIQKCYCKYKGITCEYANLDGYCKVTGCRKESDTDG